MVSHNNQESLAREHVTKARRIVARQRELIAEIKDRGGDFEEAEELLSAFRRSLAHFEDDLARIAKPVQGN
jgi:hypothetical protein